LGWCALTIARSILLPKFCFYEDLVFRVVLKARGGGVFFAIGL
jgi:hypothetical protein